jgi:hypothetical protein
MQGSNGNGQWKWIAGILAALMVGFLPGYISNRDDPTAEQFNELQANQQKILQAIAVLETQNITLLKAVDDARDRIIVLQTRGS